MVTEISFENAEKMNVTAESIADRCQENIKRLAWPALPGESVQRCISRAGRFAGLTFSTAKRVWYREISNPSAELYLRLEQAVEAHEAKLNRELEALKEHQAKIWPLTHQNNDAEFYQGVSPVDFDQRSDT